MTRWHGVAYGRGDLGAGVVDGGRLQSRGGETETEVGVGGDPRKEIGVEAERAGVQERLEGSRAQAVPAIGGDVGATGRGERGGAQAPHGGRDVTQSVGAAMCVRG